MKPLTFVASSRETHDYRIAFEVELSASGTRAEYITAPFGKDVNGGGFDADDAGDELWGHVYQSPAGVVVDTGTGQTVNRDVYGFTVLVESTDLLDDILDTVRETLRTAYPGVVTETSAVTARPAHDDLPNFRVLRAQRQLSLSFADVRSALTLRNNLLVNDVLAGVDPDPATVPPAVDPVYGSIVCPGSQRCYRNFSLYVAGVQRLDQDGPDGDPVVLLTFALTPDDSDPANPSSPSNRLFADRLTRLEDLTGGSALARFEAEIGNDCERKPATQAKADILWVVDDSRSMQQIIDRLEQAARDAKAVFTANSNIVDFRLSMTTTNASENARKLCPDTCASTCATTANCGAGLCADQALGCLKLCPSGCNTNCKQIANTSLDCPATSVCTAGCIELSNDGALTTMLSGDLVNYALPGGGGTFYYEDSEYLDCEAADSANPAHQNSQIQFINQCSDAPYSTSGEFNPFFGPAGARKKLTEHARFLSSDPAATCTSELLDLSPKSDAANTTCDPNSEYCCERLTAACTDAPTVLASEMCDLIRAMGGQPNATLTTSSARAHSAPESGSRSARRLISKLIPALPKDAVGPVPDPTQRLRLDCASSEANCDACDPRNPPLADSGDTCTSDADCLSLPRERCNTSTGQCVQACQPVPLVTIVLSDEEDFYFKDECANAYGNPVTGSDWERTAQGTADKR
ncbi:MAG: hypothetical protein IT514_16045, partial [Burkholderiales bacterium]|nr:hypothetical protein [Burkholderiales bacterium]